jgi:putative ABC transport system permease protein
VSFRLLGEIFVQTLRTLWAHKLRSFLTMFGIAWGVGSLLLLIGLGEGFRSGQKKNLARMGEDVLFIFGGTVPAGTGRTTGREYSLSYGDYLAIRDEAHNIRGVSASLNRGNITAASQWGNYGVGFMAVTPSMNKVRNFPVVQGRFFNEQDNEETRNVIVIGQEVVKNIFPGQAPLGNRLLLNGVPFEVIGVFGIMDRGDIGSNSRVMIPIRTGFKYFPYRGQETPNAVAMINYQPRIREANEEAKAEVHRIIARRHNFDPDTKDVFNEFDTIKGAETVGKIFDAMNIFLGSVGLVTLALGAIGIVNIMLVSVAERTKEIGLRKALGATNRSVLTQFFLEGAFLTMISGFVGLAFAAGLMQALGALPSPQGFDTPKLVPMSAALSIGSLAIAGIAAGLYPARKAAQLEPVEALRKE